MSTASTSPRYHALDCVRASAMLLGVFYHAILFRMLTAGGPPPGPFRGPADPSRWAADWLHSFRMPLFFLVSGFFGRMMLEKYGVSEYLRRRWYRIGVPLVVGMFTFGPLCIVSRDMTSAGPPPPPPQPPGSSTSTALLPPNLGFVDQNRDGAITDQEWRNAAIEPPHDLAGMRNTRRALPGTRPGVPGVGPPEAPPWLDTGIGVVPPFGPPGMGGPPPGWGGPPGGGGRPRPGPGEAGALAPRIFGGYARYVELHHLWFLWYLLVFVTVAPYLTRALGWLLLRPTPEKADERVRKLVRAGVAPVALGLAAAPALWLCTGPMGWTLGLQPAIFRAFPDFVLHLDPDMAYFLVFFLGGWLLHREADCLAGLAEWWLQNLVVGLFAFTASAVLAVEYGGPAGRSVADIVRPIGCVLSAVGAAATALGFLGGFQRYLDRPGRVWRYLSDTALWVYLIHQPLVLLGLRLTSGLGLPWWAQAGVVAVGASAVALGLYEAVVRPTPLVRVFGPASASRPTGGAPAPEPGPAAAPAPAG
ncbi:MAG: acyltransferase family protein [Isosphaeraceae bacterium]